MSAVELVLPNLEIRGLEKRLQIHDSRRWKKIDDHR